ncbi:ubiquitin-related modifier 1 [Galendromus occidentalis]|uniref:Ubiquitin-related modifier 1 homolog n=1 Tax=Galendromus occidentalis TaxID=34638 RepID=A0AAJ6QUG2_9ACAR|nr:ubiquitin-related modifier 1 [Galendromus occidentalis]
MCDISLEFAGGAELLFESRKKQSVSLPPQDRPWTIDLLVKWLAKNLLKGNPEMFIHADGSGVRPGILVLINEIDWELLGGKDYRIQNNDSILFVSTLHGG